MKLINSDWKEIIEKNYDIDKLEKILAFVNEQREKTIVYPKANEVFSFLNLTEFSNVKVVIIGQDPYYNEGEANGLAFSVNESVKIPPSLRNIYKELNSDLAIPIPKTGVLNGWAKQGVFLVNSSLTVEAKKPNSHSSIGWSDFTDFLIKYISDNKENVVFVLWGNFAKKKSSLIDENKHLIISSSHPSPLSARHSFFASKVFSKINSYLSSKKIETIDWSKSYDY